jgi:hypothetical protein
MPRIANLPCLATAALPVVFWGGIASAELIAPGGETTGNGFVASVASDPSFGGHLEAMQDIPFDLSDDQGKVFYVGQIRHEVMRDPKTQALTFDYQFINAPSSAIIGIESVVTGSFKGYDTNVAILVDNIGDTGPIGALRSADGSNVSFLFDDTSSRIAPNDNSFTFAVKTNATQFDNKGSTKITAFLASSTDDGSPLLAGGNATIKSFRPTGAPAVIAAPPPPTPGTVSAPLPPAFWPGLATMAGSLFYVRRMRGQRVAGRA